ncbi:hypothetical protein A9Q84_01235 [Halobacteriovorax marinus]|uniref:Ketosynthase family 3 (KS3) domain-containing protein n=1 Tax=Halobacteriovorax marinus TaxID=97084 RepID=A0A1Y5FFZ9_9BACT|nr:hypothetical protein A9Q84_01235 [Halobacteriovorax marinus]
MENVCITGMGVVSSLGNDSSELFANLKEGKCAFKEFPEWRDYNGLSSFVGAPAQEYDASGLPRNVRRSMSPMSEMAYLATVDALKDAGLDISRNGTGEEGLFRTNNLKTSLMIGSTSGSPIFLEKYYEKMIKNGGPKGQLSTSFFKIMNHSVAANVALAIGYSGPLIAASSACSSSTQAVVMALQMIRAGIYDVCVVGGADELHHSSVSVFDVVKASSNNYNDNPLDIPGPFDRDRDGLVVSEGAGIIVLESERHVKARGGKVYAHVSGGSFMCDGIHMSQPQSEEMAQTMNLALKDAGQSISEVDYVNAHATSTKVGDIQEIKAIASLGGRADMGVSSLKGHLGHSLAACGAVEIISIIEMMKNKTLIANRNVKNIMEEAEGVNVLTENVEKSIKTVLSNNFAFGGMNTSVIINNLM